MKTNAGEQAFLKALQKPNFFGASNSQVKLCETHISWVFLTDDFAYKIKKPLDLGFLDFTSLEKRHFFCCEELRLNQRQAPDIYLEVLPINGTREKPVLNGEGEILEYCLKMKRFDENRVYENLFFEDELTQNNMVDLAHGLNKLHQEARILPTESGFGKPARLLAIFLANTAEMRPWIHRQEILTTLDEIDHINKKYLNQLAPLIETRRQQGHIKECHADVHLGNIVERHGQPVLFDCIEFNEEFRCIDTLSDASFMIMDLMVNNRPDLAWSFLNAFLQENGDYNALPLLPLFLSYRAAIRAKVTFINIPQVAEKDKVQEEQTALKYLTFARQVLEKKTAHLMIMHGLSGTGKSFAGQNIAPEIGALYISSDIERKRLVGLPPLASSRNLENDLYSQDMHAKTYNKLQEITKVALKAGFSIIVDATFLRWQNRQTFASIAQDQQAHFTIISCQCSRLSHKELIERRLAEGKNPSEANWQVVTQQEKEQDSLSLVEKAAAVTIKDFACESAINQLKEKLN